MLIDAIGVKAALSNGTLTRLKLVALRDKIDEISARYPDVAFVSFADSLLLKSNWVVGHRGSEITYTYEPETIVRLLPDVMLLIAIFWGWTSIRSSHRVATNTMMTACCTYQPHAIMFR